MVDRLNPQPAWRRHLKPRILSQLGLLPVCPSTAKWRSLYNISSTLGHESGTSHGSSGCLRSLPLSGCTVSGPSSHQVLPVEDQILRGCAALPNRPEREDTLSVGQNGNKIHTLRNSHQFLGR